MDPQKEREHRIKWDIRVRDRNRLGQEESLPDLEDQAVGFSVPQPALGVAESIPGCNCPTCRG